jgi:N-acyl-D-aspartate/D-glutamate deacylase
MNPTTLNLALNLLTALPGLIEAGANVVGVIQHGTAKVKQLQTEGRDPTQAEWDELDTMVNGLRAQLHAGEEKPAQGGLG